jgi:hypothetical protein
MLIEIFIIQENSYLDNEVPRAYAHGIFIIPAFAKATAGYPPRFSCEIRRSNPYANQYLVRYPYRLHPRAYARRSLSGGG